MSQPCSAFGFPALRVESHEHGRRKPRPGYWRCSTPSGVAARRLRRGRRSRSSHRDVPLRPRMVYAEFTTPACRSPRASARPTSRELSARIREAYELALLATAPVCPPVTGRAEPRRPPTLLWEVATVWLLFFGLAAVAVFVTYWRLPPSEVWKVSHLGFAGGAGRAFVFLNSAVPPVLAIAVDRLDDRRATVTAVVAAVLCATVAAFDMLTIDAKWANLPAVFGVALAVVLSVWARRSGRPARPRAGDRARLVTAAVLVFASAPYTAGARLLPPRPRLIFETVRSDPSTRPVHHGHHHGGSTGSCSRSRCCCSRLVGTIRRGHAPYRDRRVPLLAMPREPRK